LPSPFISRQDVSDRLGRDVTADDGALSAVDSACQIVRTVAEQSFELVTGDTVTLDGTGTDCLLLPELPVTAAGTVVLNGGTISDYKLGDAGRIYRTNGTTGFSSWWATPVWPLGRQNVTVTYDHGAGTVPADVREVALNLAMRLLVQGVAVFETIASGQQIRYAGAADDLTVNELRILRKHRPNR
jgi:hypothetical protein